MNTGTQDRDGRTIFKGKSGGYFVRKGASGKKVYRKTSGSRMTPSAIGKMNALGREIMKGPRGGLFVLIAGKRRPPAKGRGLSPSSSPITKKLALYMSGKIR
jgi:hypothetical protein